MPKSIPRLCWIRSDKCSYLWFLTPMQTESHLSNSFLQSDLTSSTTQETKRNIFFPFPGTRKHHGTVRKLRNEKVVSAISGLNCHKKLPNMFQKFWFHFKVFCYDLLQQCKQRILVKSIELIQQIFIVFFFLHDALNRNNGHCLLIFSMGKTKKQEGLLYQLIPD